ncbi:UNVERIFIED_CONTAM: Transposon Ty3-I Gag-Pol polyprotein [Sesamum radiatum]|uniref:Transposon Ty3-I Gag-Pol polyprotein n=1 Tax=Sesamum radiatum TaxID=300843 RepID=A0AAW2VNL4_SESRA
MAVFHPTSISQAIGLAILLESKLLHQPFVSQFAGSVSASIRRPVAPIAATLLSTVPHVAPPAVAPRPTLPIKRLTPAEMQARRIKSFCFNCDEWFVPGHRCKPKLFFLLLADEDVEPSVQLLFRPPWWRILISLQSSHNILQPRIAQLLALPWQPISPFSVLVGNGASLFCSVLSRCLLVELTGTQPASLALASFPQFLRLLTTQSIASLHVVSLMSVADSDSSLSHFSDSDQAVLAALPSDLAALLLRNAAIFAIPRGLPPPRPHDHRIHLVSNASPVNTRPYRYPHCQKEAMAALIAVMLREGLIRPSTSPYSSPVLLVKKKDGSWRFCTDYRALNAIIVKDRFPIPTIDELLDELRGTCFFSKLDLRSGYHQIRMFPDDIHKTAFRGVDGHFEFLMSKCTFGVRRVAYLGHVVSAAGFHLRFVAHYAAIASPLTNLLKTGSFHWSTEADAAFRALKVAMTSLPVLALPDFSSTFDVTTDASTVAVGAVLPQNGHLLAFFSKTLGPRTPVASTYVRELFTITESHKWLSKLLGFNYEIFYKPGKENLVADALSRFPPVSTCFSLSVCQPTSAVLVHLRHFFASHPDGCRLLSNVSSTSKYSFRDGLLYYCQRLFIPLASGVVPLLLSEFHSSPMGGHSGTKATLARLAASFYWPSMAKDVKAFVQSCTVCQRFTAVSLASLFLKEVYRLHSAPRVIVSDRDSIFLSAFWKELFHLLGTTLAYSSSYHPQTDGQMEVLNHCLETYLCCFVSEEPHRWSQFLPLAEFWYNTFHHSSIGMSPFQALYGHLPPSILGYSPGSTKIPSLDESFQLRQHLIGVLRSNLARARQRMVQQANSKRRDRSFQVGDWVFMKLQPYRQNSVRRHVSSKLAKKFYGPFRVVRRVGAVPYELDLPESSRIHPVFHVSLLKPCFVPPADPTCFLPSLVVGSFLPPSPAQVLDTRLLGSRPEVLSFICRASLNWRPLGKMLLPLLICCPPALRARPFPLVGQ